MGNMLCPRCWGSKTQPGTPEELKTLPKDAPCVVCKGAGVIPDVQLSTHFDLSELLVSATAVRRHIPNDPPADRIDNLRKLCVDLMEPIRTKFGPIKVNSGYRSLAVNGSLPGASTTSAHPLGLAADFVPYTKGVTLKAIVDWVIASGLAFDQVIYEGTWVHIARFHPDGKQVRKQALMMFPGPDGKPKYSAYDPKDPRVI